MSRWLTSMIGSVNQANRSLILVLVLASMVSRCASTDGQQAFDDQQDLQGGNADNKDASKDRGTSNEMADTIDDSSSNMGDEEIEGGANGNFINGNIGTTDVGNPEAINNVVDDSNVEFPSNSNTLANGVATEAALPGLNASQAAPLQQSNQDLNAVQPPVTNTAQSIEPTRSVSGAPAVESPTAQSPQNVVSSPGTLSWVGYNYNKTNRKIEVQVVVEGAPTYRIFQEVNRGGQSEIVLRYLNTKLRNKIRRDIDASEFRSPVAYIRMRHDPAFTHTDVVMTLRESIQPTMSTKGSNIMLTFDVSEKWIAPQGESKPVASAEILEDVSPGLDGTSGKPSLPGESVKEKAAYVEDPGKDKFSKLDRGVALPLVPKSESANELIPDVVNEKSNNKGEDLLQNDKQEEFESFYTVLAVAQGDFQSEIPSNGGFDATGLLEDVPATQGTTEPVAASTMPNSDIVGVAAGVAAPSTVSTKKALRLDFRDAPVSQIIRMIANESNINFVIAPEAGAKRTSISLKNVPWDVALKVVLDSNRLGMQEIAPGVVRVDFLKTFTEDKDAEEKAKQATEALIPTKILVMPLNYAKAEDAVKLAKDMLPKPTDPSNVAQKRNYDRFKAQADVRSNSVIIEATPNVLATIKTLLEKLDSQTPQVRIATRLVEVVSTIANGLGFQWGTPFSFDPGRGLGFGTLPFPNYMTSQFSVDTGLSPKPGASAAIRLGSINNVMALDLKLKMYESQKLAETIQTQDVVVQDNETATVTAGSSDFISVPGSASAPGSLVEVAYNTTLNVRPHITADGAVQMKLDIKGDSPTGVSGGVSKATRNLTTTLLKQSGETAVIGGLYSSDVQKTVAGVPFLSSIPLIGGLFRTTDNQNVKKDLLIMVTPTIVGQSSSSSGGSAGIDIPSPGVTASASNVMGNSSENAASNQASPSENSNTQQFAPSARNDAGSQGGNTVPANYSNNSEDL